MIIINNALKPGISNVILYIRSNYLHYKYVRQENKNIAVFTKLKNDKKIDSYIQEK